MNIKLKAALETVFYFGVIVLVTFALQLISQHFTTEEIKGAVATSGIIFCVYLLYSLRLSSLESQKILEQLTEKR